MDACLNLINQSKLDGYGTNKVVTVLYIILMIIYWCLLILSTYKYIRIFNVQTPYKYYLHYFYVLWFVTFATRAIYFGYSVKPYNMLAAQVMLLIPIISVPTMLLILTYIWLTMLREIDLSIEHKQTIFVLFKTQERENYWFYAIITIFAIIFMVRFGMYFGTEDANTVYIVAHSTNVAINLTVFILLWIVGSRLIKIIHQFDVGNRSTKIKLVLLFGSIALVIRMINNLIATFFHNQIDEYSDKDDTDDQAVWAVVLGCLWIIQEILPFSVILYSINVGRPATVVGSDSSFLFESMYTIEEKEASTKP